MLAQMANLVWATLHLKEGVTKLPLFIKLEEATNKSHICFNKMEIP